MTPRESCSSFGRWTPSTYVPRSHSIPSHPSPLPSPLPLAPHQHRHRHCPHGAPCLFAFFVQVREALRTPSQAAARERSKLSLKARAGCQWRASSIRALAQQVARPRRLCLFMPRSTPYRPTRPHRTAQCPLRTRRGPRRAHAGRGRRVMAAPNTVAKSTERDGVCCFVFFLHSFSPAAWVCFRVHDVDSAQDAVDAVIADVHRAFESAPRARSFGRRASVACSGTGSALARTRRSVTHGGLRSSAWLFERGGRASGWPHQHLASPQVAY
jgi:hypothetical protein